jgi:hypothetical protein
MDRLLEPAFDFRLWFSWGVDLGEMLWLGVKSLLPNQPDLRDTLDGDNGALPKVVIST